MSLVIDGGGIEMNERSETQTRLPKAKPEKPKESYKQVRQDMFENLIILIVTLLLFVILLVEKTPDPLIGTMAGAGMFYLITYLPGFIPRFLEIRQQHNTQA